MIMIRLTPVSEAIPRMPVAKAKEAVILLNTPLNVTKPITRIPNERVTLSYHGQP